MKHAILPSLAVATAILFSSVGHAQYYGGGGAYGGESQPRYGIERWDEDYSYLRDPSARTHLFDPIKFIPLDKDGRSYVSFGGQARYRYDYFNNPTFGPGSNDEDGFHLQRYLLHADAHLGENLRTFVQVNSSFTDDREGGPRYGDADHFDLQQAFVDIKTPGEANPYAYLRVGRQELVYGAQRFVSPDDWRNVRRAFDGVKLSVSVPNDTVELFVTRPVFIERDQFNNDDPGSVFWGAYNVTALPELIEGASAKLDTYLLALHQTRHAVARTDANGAADADTYTAGARLHARQKPFDLDVEANYQFGSVESSSLSAWALATEVGYSLESIALKPRVAIGLDMASGSPDPEGRFNQLFPPTYDYLGHAYLFGRTNVIDVHGSVTVELTRDLAFYVAQHVFWRQNTDDALYNLTGEVVRADNGSDAAYVGNELDLTLHWQIERHTSALLGYAHFFTGDFIEDTGAAKDVDFLYASVTFTF